MSFFGVATLYGGVAIAVTVLLGIACVACIRLYLLLRRAKTARDKLIVANKSMEAAVKAKGEFLVNMSSEMRTPMNAFASFTEILAQRIAQNSTAELKEEIDGILDIIKKNSQDFLAIVNNIVDHIKIDANLLEIESIPTSIKQIIHDICRVEKPAVVAKRLDLTVKCSADIPDVILGDPVRIRQVLESLISNAIKFTEKGTITVVCEVVGGEVPINTKAKSAETKEKENGASTQESFSAASIHLKISVIDTGVGLSPTQIQELFTPFRYRDYSSQRERSTGLGLNVAMRLATLMDGTINVESTPKQGSIFSLLLNVYVPESPHANAVLANRKNQDGSGAHKSQLLSGLDIRLPRKKTEETPSNGDRPLRNTRILIVEDMMVNQVILATLLRDAGAQVSIANNGAIGVQKVMQDMDNGLFFDVILMDMLMPVMDGYEATAFLRKHGYQRPIIAVTAQVRSDDREKVIQVGCDGYIAKPIDDASLIAMIRKYTASA